MVLKSANNIIIKLKVQLVNLYAKYIHPENYTNK